MSSYSVADAKNRLSKLIDRALAGEGVTITHDIVAASAFIRRLALPLRAPDAIHIAIAGRIGAELATFDVKMADSARSLGLSVAAA